MANTIYPSFLNGILGSHATRVDLDADNIVLALVDNAGADGAPTTTDDFWDDQDGSLVNSLSGNLGTKTIGVNGSVPGVFDAADMAPAFSTVSGATVESLVMLKNTGTPATSDLICWWDTATGLPLTPNGGDVNVTFNGSGIIKV
jgi:hypothetical protein